MRLIKTMSKQDLILSSVDLISKTYIELGQNNVDADTFFNFYQSKDWYIGKNKMKNWKACIITWEKSRNNKNNTNDRSTPHFHQKGKDYGDGTF